MIIISIINNNIININKTIKKIFFLKRDGTLSEKRVSRVFS